MRTFLMPKHTGFRIGQLVRVVNPRHFAYGRIAMVMMGGKASSQVRFADLPKGIAADPNPNGFVEGFNNDQLEAIEGIPITPFYAIVTIDERNGEQEYRQQVLARGDSEDFEVIAQEIARTWYDDDDGATWDETLEAYWTDFGATVSVAGWELITLAQYVALRDILSDSTPT